MNSQRHEAVTTEPSFSRGGDCQSMTSGIWRGFPEASAPLTLSAADHKVTTSPTSLFIKYVTLKWSWPCQSTSNPRCGSSDVGLCIRIVGTVGIYAKPVHQRRRYEVKTVRRISRFSFYNHSS